MEIDEQTGTAYTFRVVLDISKGGVTEDDYSAAETVALENKNVRSHLLGVRALLVGREHAYISAVPITGETTSILPVMVAKIQSIGAAFIAAAHQAVDQVIFRPQIEQNPTVTGSLYVSGLVKIEMIYG